MSEKKEETKEKGPNEPRPGYFEFQTDIFKYHDKEWNRMIKQLEKDIKQVLRIK
jgi:hypothetical protein